MKGFLTGIGLGAAIGLWLAPETGSETRKKLMTRTADLAQHLERKFEGKSEGPSDHESTQAQAQQSGASTKIQANNDHHEAPSTLDPVAEVVNSASKTQLRKVPGIGDATARRIIESRPFESEAEIMDSKVMPEKVLKTLKDKLVDADEEVA